MKKTKKAVGSAGLIAMIMGIAFYVFTPDQVDLKSRDVQCLIIHCSATREGQKNITPNIVDGWHTLPKQKGGRGESVNPYNVGIGLDTVIWYRRWNNDSIVNKWEISWGSAEYNICSYNVFYTGGMNKEFTKAKNTLTQYQDSMLWDVVINFKKQYPNAFVIGHNQVHRKACPSFSVPKWIKYHSVKHEKYNKEEFNL